MTYSRRFFPFLMILIPVVLAAQLPPEPELDPANYKRILIPIAFVGEEAGGYGSRWRSRLLFRNNAPYPVIISQGSPECFVVCGAQPTFRYDAKSTFELGHIDSPTFHTNNPGVLIHIERRAFDDVFVEARVTDVSRQTESLGVEVPIVREEDTFAERAVLLDVPMAARFRSLLRLYTFSGGEDASIVVRVYPLRGETLLFETRLDLQGFRGSSPILFPPWPAYAELPLQSPVGESVRIELESLTPQVRFWPMVSVTNNNTQEVTLITP